MNTVEELFNAVRKWGENRRISDPYTQTVKVGEEFGEICHEISRGHLNSDELADALGDAMVTIIILANICGFDAESCLELAYNEIADRKGKTIRGGFVKEENV